MTMLFIALAYFCTAVMLILTDQVDVGIVLILFGILNIYLYYTSKDKT